MPINTTTTTRKRDEGRRTVGSPPASNVEILDGRVVIVDEPNEIEPTRLLDSTAALGPPTPRARGPPPPFGAYTIPDFCAAHGLGVTHFYALMKQGLAPRTILIGRRRLVSIEAAAEWRRERTA
jgi:predicted DNA-binding transcriptional regulator AlpA